MATISNRRASMIRNFTLTFVDGGQKVYHVDDCTAGQLKDVVELMKKNGVPVLK